MKHKNISILIRQYRLKHNLTQYSLGEKLKMTSQFISNCERHVNGFPEHVLVEIIKILCIPKNEVKDALLKDQAESIDSFLGYIA